MAGVLAERRVGVLAERRVGVLLHPTSLPGPGPNGTLGNDALRFVDWLVAGGFTVWQTLPLGPVDEHRSPYRLQSTYAGNPALLDAERLVELDALPASLDLASLDLTTLDDLPALFRSFRADSSAEQWRAFSSFVRRDRRWLLPFALFEILRDLHGGAPWWEWPERWRDPRSHDLRVLLAAERERFRAVCFRQYLFELSWSSLKRYANTRGVQLFGDLPFYVDRNSVEVWWYRSLFKLDERGRPTAVSGVPPDYFNEDGQLWGNPLYDWDEHERTGFDWWVRRLELELSRFDLLRIDHFRALESCWEVPAGAPTAREGAWQPVPGAALLEALSARLGRAPLVAEDLGLITDEVRELRDRFELPGMAVLEFAYDGLPDNPHRPAAHRENAVVYTGTHDNDTLVGWYRSLDAPSRDRVIDAFGGREPTVPDELIEAAYASVTRLAIVPLQDLLALDSDARMNRPGTVERNWQWRFEWAQIGPGVAAEARERALRHGRLPGAVRPA